MGEKKKSLLRIMDLRNIYTSCLWMQAVSRNWYKIAGNKKWEDIVLAATCVLADVL